MSGFSITKAIAGAIDTTFNLYSKHYIRNTAIIVYGAGYVTTFPIILLGHIFASGAPGNELSRSQIISRSAAIATIWPIVWFL